MKTSKVYVAVVAIVLLAFTACAPLPATDIAQSKSEHSASSTISASISVSIPATETERNSLPSSSPTTIDETMAIETSINLYEDGYLPFMVILRGTEIDPTQSVTIRDTTFYRLTKYDTREQLETALGNSFTEGFIQRNFTGFFDGSQYPHMIEHEGYVYVMLLDGIGGTYELATDTIGIEGISTLEWTFKMNAIDMWEQKASEDQVCFFTVINESGQWLIDSIEIRFSDGSSNASY